MRKRVKLIYNSMHGWCVDLPTYAMLPDSMLPTLKNICDGDGISPLVDERDPDLPTFTVEVDVPDDYCNPATGEIEIARVRAAHRGHGYWDDQAKRYDI